MSDELWARPIESLAPDAYDRVVARCLLQELYNDVKTFVGMVNHEVLRPNGREDVAVKIPNPLGVAGFERLKQ